MTFYKIAALTVLTVLMGLVNARAQEIETGVGLICDTKEQVEDFNAAFHGSNTEALAVVNKEASPPPCGIAAVAYLKGDTVGSVKKGNDTFNIVAIVVVAVHLPQGWTTVSPLPQFTLIKSEDKEA